MVAEDCGEWRCVSKIKSGAEAEIFLSVPYQLKKTFF
jgi:hypothetical protein